MHRMSSRFNDPHWEQENVNDSPVPVRELARENILPDNIRLIFRYLLQTQLGLSIGADMRERLQVLEERLARERELFNDWNKLSPGVRETPFSMHAEGNMIVVKGPFAYRDMVRIVLVNMRLYRSQNPIFDRYLGGQRIQEEYDEFYSRLCTEAEMASLDLEVGGSGI